MILNKGLSYFVGRLGDNNPLTFVRFGNGEWDCIFGTRNVTGSGSQVLDDDRLSKGVLRAAVFNGPDYLKGVQHEGFLRRTGHWDRVRSFIGEDEWYQADVFHWASKNGRLFPLLERLRNLRVGIVGPSWLRRLQEIVPFSWFVEVPSKNCFDQYSQIRTKVLLSPGVDLYSFSCGPAAKPMIYQLHKCLGQESFLIDFGSLWDVYCGVSSRGYHYKMTQEILKCNVTGQCLDQRS